MKTAVLYDEDSPLYREAEVAFSDLEDGVVDAVGTIDTLKEMALGTLDEPMEGDFVEVNFRVVGTKVIAKIRCGANG